MTTKLTTIFAIAAAVLLLALSAPAWAGSDSQCGMNMSGHKMAASDGQQEQSATPEMHQGHEMMGEMDMSMPHGGQTHEIGPYQFETVFTESDVRLYVTRTDEKPVDPEKLSGTATIVGPKDKTQAVEFTTRKVADDPMAVHRHMAGMSKDATTYMSAPYTFGNLPDKAVTVDFALAGLTGTDDGNAKWAQEFAMTPLYGNACPMHADQAMLTDGTCSICGGMKLQPARVLYGCCPGCPEMRSTSPATCQKCGMEMNLESVGKIDETAPAQDDHHMNKGGMDHSG